MLRTRLLCAAGAAIAFSSAPLCAAALPSGTRCSDLDSAPRPCDSHVRHAALTIPKPTVLILLAESALLAAIVVRERRRPEPPPPGIVPPVLSND
jgi:hypothetical protein